VGLESKEGEHCAIGWLDVEELVLILIVIEVKERFGVDDFR